MTQARKQNWHKTLRAVGRTDRWVTGDLDGFALAEAAETYAKAHEVALALGEPGGAEYLEKAMMTGVRALSTPDEGLDPQSWLDLVALAVIEGRTEAEALAAYDIVTRADTSVVFASWVPAAVRAIGDVLVGRGDEAALTAALTSATTGDVEQVLELDLELRGALAALTGDHDALSEAHRALDDLVRERDDALDPGPGTQLRSLVMVALEKVAPGEVAR